MHESLDDKALIMKCWLWNCRSIDHEQYVRIESESLKVPRRSMQNELYFASISNTDKLLSSPHLSVLYRFSHVA